MTHHLLYWLGTGWWSLGLACAWFMCVQNLPVVFAMVLSLFCTFCRPFLTSYGMSYFLIPHSLWSTPFRGWALLDYRPFFLRPTLLLLSAILLSFPVVPSCHSYYDVIWPQPAGPLWACCLFFSQWLNMFVWALYYIACGLFCPIYFLLGILSSFAFLGLPWPFS